MAKEKEVNYVVLYPNGIPTLVDIDDIKEIMPIGNVQNAYSVIFNSGMIWQTLMADGGFERYKTLKENKN